MNRYFKSCILYALLLLFAAIQGGCLFNSETDLNNTTIQESGRKLYSVKCSGCHNLFDPGNYTKSEWKLLVKNMQVRSKITDYEKDIILHYVLANAK